MLSQTQFSKSEFYYDPRSSGVASSALRDEALLNMRWRARLRRYHPPTADARTLLSGAGLGPILRSIRTPAAGMNPGAIVTVILGQDPETMAGWLDQRVGKATSRQTGGVFH
jgi:hypothetical protein